MNEKKTNSIKWLRMAADIAMMIMMPLLMAYSMVGELLHEFFGIAIFLLFITHHILNRKWLSSLKSGKWTTLRKINTVINILMFLLMLMMMVSALIISKHIFAALELGGAAFARILHLFAANWLFVLMSLHLGLHVNALASSLGIRGAKKPARLFAVLSGLIAAYGCYALIRRGIPSYLFLTKYFAYFDLSESAVLFILDYLAVMDLFAVLAYLAARLITKSAAGNKDKAERTPAERKKARRRFIAALLVIALIGGLAWGIPYMRRHFVTVSVDSTKAAALPDAGLSGKTLIVQFTRVGNTDFDADVDAVSSASLMLDENGALMGNSELLAKMVQNACGGDIYPIRVKELYPSSYADTVSAAGKEFRSTSLPELAGLDAFPATEDYERMILVFPLWWGTVPKAVESFLSRQDLSGMKVYLILTHGGGGAGSVPEDLAPMLKGTTLDDRILLIYDDDADEAANDVYEWLKTID